MMETPPGTSFDGTLERAKQAESWMLAQPEVHGLFAGIGVSGPAGPGQVTNAVIVAILKSRARARAQRAGDHDRRARGARRHPRPRRARSRHVVDDDGRRPRRARVRAARRPRDRRARPSLRPVHRAARGRARLRRPGQDAEGRPARAARDSRPREGRAPWASTRARSRRSCRRAIGGIDIAKFKDGGHRYDVRVRLEEEFRGDPDAIGALYVRTQGRRRDRAAQHRARRDRRRAVDDQPRPAPALRHGLRRPRGRSRSAMRSSA